VFTYITPSGSLSAVSSQGLEVASIDAAGPLGGDLRVEGLQIVMTLVSHAGGTWVAPGTRDL
jgi:hypothetical protein